MLWSFALAAIPIERSKVNRKSADTAAELIEDGWNLVIFPEGGRSPDGWAQPFRGRRRLPGPAHRPAGRPGVPARHAPRAAQDGGRRGAGTRRVGHRGAAGGRLRRSPIAVLFGAPMTPDEGENAHRFSDRVEAAVGHAAREVHSDWWQARRSVSARRIRSRGPRPPTGVRRRRPGGGPGRSTSHRRGPAHGVAGLKVEPGSPGLPACPSVGRSPDQPRAVPRHRGSPRVAAEVDRPTARAGLVRRRLRGRERIHGPGSLRPPRPERRRTCTRRCDDAASTRWIVAAYSLAGLSAPLLRRLPVRPLPGRPRPLECSCCWSVGICAPGRCRRSQRPARGRCG